MQPVIQLIGSGAIGGGTTVVLALSQGLANRGIPVVVASERGSFLIEAARDFGLETLELDFGSRFSTPGLAIRIGRAIQKLKPSVLHAHGARAGLPAALIPGMLRCPFVYTVHGFHYVSKPIGLRALARHAERFCMNKARATVFVSDFDRGLATSNDVMPEHAGHMVIHNGSARTCGTAEGGVEPSIDLVFLGRLHPQKNPLALADILVSLRPLEPELVIIGDGELEAALKQRLLEVGVAHQVRFLGPRPLNEALQLLAQARVMVLPSASEGLPMALIEAMHRGVPTVASNVGGVGELIEDGITGFLVAPGDTQVFADRVRSLLLNELLRITLGRAAQALARSAFSVERNLNQHLALYDYIVGRAETNNIDLIRRQRCDA